MSSLNLKYWQSVQNLIDEWFLENMEYAGMEECTLFTDYLFIEEHGDMDLSYSMTWKGDKVTLRVKQKGQGIPHYIVTEFKVEE